MHMLANTAKTLWKKLLWILELSVFDSEVQLRQTA